MKKIVWLFREKANHRDEYSEAINWNYGALEAFGYDVAYEWFPEYGYGEFDIDGLCSRLRSHGADIVLHVAYEKVHPEMEKIRDFAKLYVLQSDDDWRFDNFAKHWVPFVDGTISFAGDWENYKNLGISEEKFIHTKWAFNPNTMQKDVSKGDDKILLSHAGGLHSNRRSLIAEFRTKGIDVNTISECYYEEIKRLWAESKYSLSFTMNSIMTGPQVKGRVAEIPYHTVMLSEWFKGIENYYEPNKEFISFENTDEAIDKIKHYEKNPKDYSKIFEAGRNRLLSTGTCYHRWNDILNRLDPDFKKYDVSKILKDKHGILI
jgi:hypothetical protein